MKKQPFLSTYKTIISAPVEKVWEALTNPEIVKHYFFGSNLVTTWSVGEPIYFRGEYDGKPYEDKGIVKTYEENKTLSFTYYTSWSELPDEPENYQLVTYTVTPSGGGTELTITQTHFSEERAKHSESNWELVVDGLKKILN